MHNQKFSSLGPSGFINADVIKKHVGSAELKDKIKIFICGPPGQVAAVAGSKAGPKQGEIGGILKELGYNEDQVGYFFTSVTSIWVTEWSPVQVFKF